MIVDCAVYEAGVRRPGHASFAGALDAAADGRRTFAWIGLHDPSQDELESVAAAFHLHPLAVEDAIHAHQRPKLDVYDGTLFMVLKAARYVDREEVVELGEVMLFVGPRFVVTVRHGPAGDLGPVRRALEALPERLAWGPATVLHAVTDLVVDEYATVLEGLDVDVDEIEEEVFSSAHANHAERIFKLKREVLEFRRAVAPLVAPVERLAAGSVPCVEVDAQHYFRDVHDHVVRVADRLDALDHLLTSALDANVAQLGVRQNEDMRKISAWVAIIALPTMIAGVYGMNFDHMPGLGARFGFPLALAAMAAVALLLYRNFKRRSWL